MLAKLSIDEGKLQNFENKVNVILFGPSFSGKSSLVQYFIPFQNIMQSRTFYKALHDAKTLPSEISDQLIIHKMLGDTGTEKFTSIPLKKTSKTILNAGQKILLQKTSEINIIDTRGQVSLDDKEKGQLNVMIDVSDLMTPQIVKREK